MNVRLPAVILATAAMCVVGFSQSAIVKQARGKSVRPLSSTILLLFGGGSRVASGLSGFRMGFSSILTSFVAAALLLASLCKVIAAPPADAELQNRAWFESLEQPGERHLPCCSVADCHLTASRASQTGYEVEIEDSWIVVPDDRVLEDVSNPTGRAVVCYRRVVNPDLNQSELRIFCFVRPPET
jgi:hypothetical protein